MTPELSAASGVEMLRTPETWQREENVVDANEIQQLREILCESSHANINSHIRDLWKEVNGMKKLIMTAMGGVILQVIVFIGAVVLMLIQRG